MSRLSMQIPPRFVSLEGGVSNDTDNPEGFRFRLVSYNILAQVYVKSCFFPHSPFPCLKWKKRSEEICSALTNFGADFLCIQELDEYDSFYKSRMENNGYSTIYIQRSGKKRDGCGIFYKSERVELVMKEEIEYNDLVEQLNDFSLEVQPRKGTSEEDSFADNSDDDRDYPKDPHVRLERDCVGLLAAFKLDDPSNHVLIVGTTHIYWDPKWIDVKLAQVRYLLVRLTQFKSAVSIKYSCSPSVIIAGDFNSTPDDEVYNYIVSAKAATVHEKVPLMELYSLYGANGGEPPYTNCTPGFTGTLDYIFLSKDSNLKPVSLLEIPGNESPSLVGGLPNFCHPSDHLPIGGDFKIMDNTSVAPTLQNALFDLKI